MMSSELVVSLSPHKKGKRRAYCQAYYVDFYVWNLTACRADRHMPSYAKKLVEMYNKNGEIERMLSNK